jgi:hypothetical protein
MRNFIRRHLGKLALAGIICSIFGIAYAQNAGQTLSTLVGTELFPVQSSINSTAAITYASVNQVRNSRGWVYAAPASGTLTMTTAQSAVSLNPSGTISAYTVVLPPTPQDGAVVSIFTSATITTLTLSTSDSSTFVPTKVTTLTAGSSVGYVYDNANNVWHRIM